MTQEINPDCPHVNFQTGICEECGFVCEHQWEVEHDICLECGKFLEPWTKADYLDNRGMEDYHDVA